MNPNIILAGQGPDVVNALAGGTALGQQVNDGRYQQQYRNALRTHGAGAVQGDPAAQAALAGFDMEAVQGLQVNALNMDATRLNMDSTRQQMRYLDAEQARAVAEAARSMSAEQREQTAARIRSAVASGLQATPEQWDALMSRSPETQQFVGRWGEREMIAGGYLEMADAIEMAQGPELPASIQALEIRAERAGLQPGTPEYQAFMASGGVPSSNTSLRVNPDGSIAFDSGTGAGGASTNFTEGQSKDNVYSTRARGALEILEPVASALTGRLETMADSVPLGIGRELQSEDFQVARQAGQEFLVAILRKDTGAAVTPQEDALYGDIYLPRPGDGDAVLESKRQARIRAINAIEAGMSPAQMLAQERGLANAAAESGTGAQPSPRPAQPATNANGPVVQGNVTPQSIMQMTPMQLAEFMSTTTDLSVLPDEVLEAIIARGE